MSRLHTQQQLEHASQVPALPRGLRPPEPLETDPNWPLTGAGPSLVSIRASLSPNGGVLSREKGLAGLDVWHAALSWAGWVARSSELGACRSDGWHAVSGPDALLSSKRCTTSKHSDIIIFELNC